MALFKTCLRCFVLFGLTSYSFSATTPLQVKPQNGKNEKPPEANSAVQTSPVSTPVPQARIQPLGAFFNQPIAPIGFQPQSHQFNRRQDGFGDLSLNGLSDLISYYIEQLQAAQQQEQQQTNQQRGGNKETQYDEGGEEQDYSGLQNEASAGGGKAQDNVRGTEQGNRQDVGRGQQEQRQQQAPEYNSYYGGSNQGPAIQQGSSRGRNNYGQRGIDQPIYQNRELQNNYPSAFFPQQGQPAVPSGNQRGQAIGQRGFAPGQEDEQAYFGSPTGAGALGASGLGALGSGNQAGSPYVPANRQPQGQLLPESGQQGIYQRRQRPQSSLPQYQGQFGQGQLYPQDYQPYQGQLQENGYQQRQGLIPPNPQYYQGQLFPNFPQGQQGIYSPRPDIALTRNQGYPQTIQGDLDQRRNGVPPLQTYTSGPISTLHSDSIDSGLNREKDIEGKRKLGQNGQGQGNQQGDSVSEGSGAKGIQLLVKESTKNDSEDSETLKQPVVSTDSKV